MYSLKGEKPPSLGFVPQKSVVWGCQRLRLRQVEASPGRRRRGKGAGARSSWRGAGPRPPRAPAAQTWAGTSRSASPGSYYRCRTSVPPDLHGILAWTPSVRGWATWWMEMSRAPPSPSKNRRSFRSRQFGWEVTSVLILSTYPVPWRPPFRAQALQAASWHTCRLMHTHVHTHAHAYPPPHSDFSAPTPQHTNNTN